MHDLHHPDDYLPNQIQNIFKIKHNFLLKHNVTYNNFCKNSIKLIFLQIEEFYLYMDHRKSLQNTLRMILISFLYFYY